MRPNRLYALCFGGAIEHFVCAHASRDSVRGGDDGDSLAHARALDARASLQYLRTQQQHKVRNGPVRARPLILLVQPLKAKQHNGPLMCGGVGSANKQLSAFIVTVAFTK